MVVLTTFTQPTEGIRQRQPNTTAYVNDNNLGKGTLYIAESCLSWISDSGSGFSIEYPNISLHAVSRDLTAFPHECLFLMLDIALEDENTKNGEGENCDGSDGSDDEQATTELRFVPDDRGMLDAMFHAMNACQALHPDPEDSVSDEDIFEDADNDIQMEETDSRMANLNLGGALRMASLGNNHMGLEERDILDPGVGLGVGLPASVGFLHQGHRIVGASGRAVNMVGVGRHGEEEVVVGVADRLQQGGQSFGSNTVEEGFAECFGSGHRAQGDRSYLLGNNLHQDTAALVHEVDYTHMASHFSDAES